MLWIYNNRNTQNTLSTTTKDNVSLRKDWDQVTQWTMWGGENTGTKSRDPPRVEYVIICQATLSNKPPPFQKKKVNKPYVLRGSSRVPALLVGIWNSHIFIISAVSFFDKLVLSLMGLFMVCFAIVIFISMFRPSTAGIYHSSPQKHQCGGGKWNPETWTQQLKRTAEGTPWNAWDKKRLNEN